MTLTLGNNLTGTVAREVSASNRTLSGLGESMATGENKFVQVVDKFLGNSLRDKQIILNAIANNTNYSINMLTTADEYLNTIATSLQDALKTIGSAGSLSSDKLAVLQKNLDDKKAHVKLLVDSADFDNKKLLSGDAVDLSVQIGSSLSDKIGLKINDYSSDKIFRSTVSTKLSEYIAADNTRSRFYTTSGGVTAQFATDVRDNNNLIYNSVNAAYDANAANASRMTAAQFGTALATVISATPSIGDYLNQVAPLGVAALGNGVDFSNATAAQIQAAYGAGNEFGNGAVPVADEMKALFVDNLATDITGNDVARVKAQDVITSALNVIRAEQAAVSSQKNNVIDAADALRATNNVTEQAANSYLKTDYVITAQEYSEQIRTMTAAITALQASNKIPEAALQLVQGTAR